MGNKSNRKTFLSENIISRINCGKRQTVTMSDNNDLKFGCLFDIDGVLLRGKTPIPVAAEAMKMIYKNGQFTVPTVFCTNGFGLRERKAASLTAALGVDVDPDQVIMSQSPLEMFYDYHDKTVLIVGPEHDGGFYDVAKDLGFNKIVTLDDVRKAYPYLDWVDRKLWPKTEARDDPDFPKIEAVVILGEPLNWEGALQLILDVIQTDGKPNKPLESNTSQIPVLASNMDLQVISDDHLPGLINRLSGWPKLPFPVLVMVLFFSAWKPYTKNLPGIHWNIRHSWASRRSSLINILSN